MPGKSTGGSGRNSIERLTFLMDSHVVLRLQSVSPFTSPCSGATLDLLTPSKRRRLRQPSPHHRVTGPFHQWLIGSTYRPSGGVGLHRSCLRTIFSRRRRVAPTWSAFGSPRVRRWNEELGYSLALHPRAVTGAPRRPKTPSPEVILLGPFVTPPSPDLPVAARWLLTSAVCCGVWARCSARARTRTGRLGRLLSSFHRLTLSSVGKLSPEPLRLTRPFRAGNTMGARILGFRCATPQAVDDATLRTSCRA